MDKFKTIYLILSALERAMDTGLDERELSAKRLGISESRFLSLLEMLQEDGVIQIREAGGSVGIYTEERVGQNGPYTVVLYSPGAQHFLLDNIDAILEINNAPKGKSTEAEQP